MNIYSRKRIINYKITTRTLGQYIGAECEYEEYFGSKSDGGWQNRKFKLSLRTAHNFECIGYRNPILQLRLLSSMTEQEAKELAGIMELSNVNWGQSGYQERHSYSFCIGPFEDYNSVYFLVDANGHFDGFEGLEFTSGVNVTQIIDYLRSRGFDVGGWIQVSEPCHENRSGEWEIHEIWSDPKWVPSLIYSKLAVGQIKTSSNFKESCEKGTTIEE